MAKKSEIIISKDLLQKIWSQVPVDYYDNLNFFQKLWHEQKIHVFYKLLAKYSFKRILEIGCANGHLTVTFASWFPKSQIVGIDVYKPMVAAANKRFAKNKNVSFLTADAHKLPYKKNSFDLVVCSETIEHVVNPEKVLSEMIRVLKSNGILLVEMDSGSLLFRTIWYLYTHFLKGKVWKNAHLHPFSAKQLKQLIRQSNVKIITSKRSHLDMAVTYLAKKEGKK